ncbi:MAG: hypothetical protein LBE82_04555 [Chitinophagaceae bacterium]|jgi:hypothetical protein|nr:hypothetical protein [Chitinophagaceae bacterium]
MKPCHIAARLFVLEQYVAAQILLYQWVKQIQNSVDDNYYCFTLRFSF